MIARLPSPCGSLAFFMLSLPTTWLNSVFLLSECIPCFHSKPTRFFQVGMVRLEAQCCVKACTYRNNRQTKQFTLFSRHGNRKRIFLVDPAFT